MQLGLHEPLESGSNLNLHSGGMFMVHDWFWLENVVSESELQSPESTDSDEVQDSDDSGGDNITHIVTFKCIGVTHDHHYQATLQAAADALKNGKDVQVRLTPEPDNPQDKSAVAFECYVLGKWERVGYVVKELLPEVHAALRNGRILSVTFAWIKFLLCWRRSGPGFYAGIKIRKQGKWSSNVVRHASTK